MAEEEERKRRRGRGVWRTLRRWGEPALLKCVGSTSELRRWARGDGQRASTVGSRELQLIEPIGADAAAKKLSWQRGTWEESFASASALGL